MIHVEHCGVPRGEVLSGGHLKMTIALQKQNVFLQRK